MRLGIGSYTYPWAGGVPERSREATLTTRGLLARAASLGVQVLQVCDHLPLDRLDHSELDRLAGRARERGIEVQVGTRGLGRQHLQTHLCMARRVSSPVLRVVTDSADSRPTAEEVVRGPEAVARADAVVLAAPDASIRSVSEELLPHARRGAAVVLLDPAAPETGRWVHTDLTPR